MKLLIVDDDADVRRLARVALERVGEASILEARSAAEGIALALAKRPDAILLDLHLPDMPAAEVLTAIRQHEGGANIPVMLLTESRDRSELEELSKLGVTTVISKPFDPLRLASLVRRTCGEHRRAVGLAETLGVLRVRFLEGAPKRLARLDEALGELRRDAASGEALTRLRGELHAMVGAAGCYGLDEVSGPAAEAEDLCVTLAHAGKPADGVSLDRLGRAAASIRQGLDVFGAMSARREPGRGRRPEEAPGAGDARSTSRALIAVEDPEQVRDLEACLRQQGVDVEPVRTREQALDFIAGKKVPDALVTDVSLSDGSGLDVIRKLRALPGGRAVPVFAVGDSGHIADRASALRSGASVYLLKPYDPAELCSRLLTLLTRRASRRDRILLAEDDADQAEYVRALLESAGYQVCACSGHDELEEALRQFEPKLLLMDVDLTADPDGVAFARSIRQDPAMASVPIVYLTTRSDELTRVVGVEAGGGDCLQKPVRPEVLLRHVAASLQRSRLVQELIDRDGLTELLTHPAFMDALEATLEQYRGAGLPCALVLVDIDHFKQVNDTRGRAIGDHVLKACAQLVQGRCRSSDVAGRYGGEEFGLVLLGASETDAERLANGLREEFSKHEHHDADGEAFRCTFSAGIAMLGADVPDAEQWVRDADSALYAAKVGGRNRVVAVSAKLESGSLDF